MEEVTRVIAFARLRARPRGGRSGRTCKVFDPSWLERTKLSPNGFRWNFIRMCL